MKSIGVVGLCVLIACILLAGLAGNSLADKNGAKGKTPPPPIDHFSANSSFQDIALAASQVADVLHNVNQTGQGRSQLFEVMRFDHIRFQGDFEGTTGSSAIVYTSLADGGEVLIERSDGEPDELFVLDEGQFTVIQGDVAHVPFR